MSVTPPPYGQDPRGPAGPGQYPVTGPTPPTDRPTLVSSMAIATELWILVTIAQIVTVCGQFTLLGDQVDQVRDDMAEQGQPVSYAVVVAIVIVMAVVMIGGICGTLTWLARSGRNWARIGLGFLSFYLVVQTVYAFFVDGADHWTMIPTVIGGVAALGAGVLLVHRDSDKYCKDMAAWRAERKRNPPVVHYGPGSYSQPGQPGQYPGQYQNGQYPNTGYYPAQPPYGQPGYQAQPYQPPPAPPEPGQSQGSGDHEPDTGERK